MPMTPVQAFMAQHIQNLGVHHEDLAQVLEETFEFGCAANNCPFPIESAPHCGHVVYCWKDEWQRFIPLKWVKDKEQPTKGLFLDVNSDVDYTHDQPTHWVPFMKPLSPISTIPTDAEPEQPKSLLEKIVHTVKRIAK